MMTMPSQVLFIYGALVTLVYLGTDGFKNNAPFVFAIPVMMLGVFTCGTNMKRKKKVLTALSFFTLAIALYQWSMYPKRLELSAFMIGVSHLFYLLSFIRSLRRIWVVLAVGTCAVTTLFMYVIFADLFRSVPTLVLTLSMTISALALSFVIAGSVWRNGSKSVYEEKAAFVRFLGMFFMMICDSALLVNHFAKHTQNIIWYLNFTYYISQFLLYIANERAY